jgi:hypothetical protein
MFFESEPVKAPKKEAYIMPDIVDWSEVNTQDGNRSKDGIRNLKLQTDNTYELRFIGHPLKFYKYFVAGKSAICADPAVCSVRKKYNIEPGVRYAVNVINRADKQLYLLEVPPSVLKPVAAWGKRRNADPGGKSGCDFSISVTGKAKLTRYEVVPLDVTPLTDEEKDYCRANVYDLNKLFKATPDKDMEERLFGKGGGNTTQQAPRGESESNSGSGSKVELPF